MAVVLVDEDIGYRELKLGIATFPKKHQVVWDGVQGDGAAHSSESLGVAGRFAAQRRSSPSVSSARLASSEGAGAALWDRCWTSWKRLCWAEDQSLAPT